MKQKKENHVKTHLEWPPEKKTFLWISGDNVIHSYTTATAHEGFTGKTWLDAFKSLATSCVKNVHKESDKDAVAAIHSMSYALQYSHTLDFHTLSELVTCSVDEVRSPPS